MDTHLPLVLAHALAPWSEAGPLLAAVLAQLSCDVALLIDTRGAVNSVALAPAAAPALAPLAGWQGRHWVDLAQPDSRDKAERLLAETLQHGATPHRRQLNHVSGAEPVALSWAALRLGPVGPVLAAGHDLAAAARLQQRLLSEQLAIAREREQLLAAAARQGLRLGAGGGNGGPVG